MNRKINTKSFRKIVLFASFIGLIFSSQNLINFTVAELNGKNNVDSIVCNTE